MYNLVPKKNVYCLNDSYRQFACVSIARIRFDAWEERHKWRGAHCVAGRNPQYPHWSDFEQLGL